jgi:hypothetical protein
MMVQISGRYKVRKPIPTPMLVQPMMLCPCKMEGKKFLQQIRLVLGSRYPTQFSGPREFWYSPPIHWRHDNVLPLENMFWMVEGVRLGVSCTKSKGKFCLFSSSLNLELINYVFLYYFIQTYWRSKSYEDAA